jgi:elongin-C
MNSVRIRILVLLIITLVSYSTAHLPIIIILLHVVIDRRCALISGTIKAMLTSQFAESKGEIRFPDIHTAVLEKVIQYLYFKARYTNSNKRVPDFIIEPEICLELTLAANYLQC